MLNDVGRIRYRWWGRWNAERIHSPSVPSGRCCIGPIAALAFRRWRSGGGVLEWSRYISPRPSDGVELDEKCPGHSVALFTETTSSPRRTMSISILPGISVVGSVSFSTQYGRITNSVPVMLCPYIYVDDDAALACGWTQGVPKNIGSIFQARLLQSQARRGAACSRQPIWREPLRAWSASCGSLRHPAQTGRKRTVSARPAHGLAAVLSETGGRTPG